MGGHKMAKELVSSIPGAAFLREARAELKKVTWPSRKQIGYWTLIVIVLFYLIVLI